MRPHRLKLTHTFSVEKRFPSCSSGQLVTWMNEVRLRFTGLHLVDVPTLASLGQSEDAGLLRKTQEANQFEVTVHDTDLFHRKITDSARSSQGSVTWAS